MHLSTSLLESAWGDTWEGRGMELTMMSDYFSGFSSCLMDRIIEAFFNT